MALSIKDEPTDRLARQLAQLTGETLTEAVKRALAERLQREKRRRGRQGIAQRLMEVGAQCAALPTRDDRSADEILYDERGLPK